MVSGKIQIYVAPIPDKYGVYLSILLEDESGIYSLKGDRESFIKVSDNPHSAFQIDEHFAEIGYKSTKDLYSSMIESLKRVNALPEVEHLMKENYRLQEEVKNLWSVLKAR